MKITTLCYLIQNNQYLMLYRNKKKEDPNAGKWIGVGGKIEEGESPKDCVIRECREETGFLIQPCLRGIITFISDQWEDEVMFLYTAEQFEGTLKKCPEGDLQWINREALSTLNLWEGDRHFLALLQQDAPFFTMKLIYQKDKLIQWVKE